MPDRDQTIELLRGAYEAFNRGDVETSWEIFDPEIELIQPSELPGGIGTYRGFEGLGRALSELMEAFEEYTMEPEEFLVAGDQAAIVVNLHGRGRASHLEVDMRVGHLATLRRGRVVRWEVFLSPEDAVAALH